jgi:hypothetical protein
MKDKTFFCENGCSKDECTCWCKCWLPYNQCICDMTEEDWEKYSEQLDKLREKDENITYF